MAGVTATGEEGWHWSTLIDFGQSSQSRYCTQVAAATAVAGVVASC